MMSGARLNLGGSGGMLPQENFGHLHLPRCILVHSDSILAHKYL